MYDVGAHKENEKNLVKKKKYSFHFKYLHKLYESVVCIKQMILTKRGKETIRFS